MKTRAVLGLALLVATLPTAAPAGEADAKTYHVGTQTKHTNVTFTSEADVENIYGTTNVASGTVWLDLVDRKGKASITVPVKHMKTGIELRDEHLRSEQWLDEKKHPDITFVTDGFEVAETNREKGIHEAKVKGKLTIHGVTKDLETAVRITVVPSEKSKILGEGDWVRVVTGFEVKLSDFGVKIPEGPVQGKVSDVWAVKFDGYATTTAPSKAGK